MKAWWRVSVCGCTSRACSPPRPTVGTGPTSECGETMEGTTRGADWFVFITTPTCREFYWYLPAIVRRIQTNLYVSVSRIRQKPEARVAVAHYSRIQDQPPRPGYTRNRPGFRSGISQAFSPRAFEAARASEEPNAGTTSRTGSAARQKNARRASSGKRWPFPAWPGRWPYTGGWS